ncbi:putative reverse transcriptase domain-containing protein [Tanacetum coccineum]
MYIPETRIQGFKCLAEDEAPTPLLPPSFLSPHDIPEADTLPRKRLLLTTPRPECEVGESSVAVAARQPGPAMAHRVDYSLVDTMETRFRDTERRMMTALEMVNMRVSYQVDVRSRESSEPLIDQGVAAAMAEAEASKVRNGYNSNGSGPRPAQTARECSYSEFLKCKPLDFKGTEGHHAKSNLRLALHKTMLLTWWNAHVKNHYPLKHLMLCPLGKSLKKMMTDNTRLRGRSRRLRQRLDLRERKRKYDDLSKNNQNQQQQNKRQNTGQAYHMQAIVTGNHTPSLNLYVPTQGHFRRNCPKLRNNDRGNQAGNDRALAKVYVVRNAGANPDNVVAGTFLLNNRYAYILFDTGADRSFVSTAFSSQIDITPSTLDHY